MAARDELRRVYDNSFRDPEIAETVRFRALMRRFVDETKTQPFNSRIEESQR